MITFFGPPAAKQTKQKKTLHDILLSAEEIRLRVAQ